MHAPSPIPTTTVQCMTTHGQHTIRIRRSSIPIPLTVNGRIGTSSDGIHLPLREIVIHHMNIPQSTPRHPLHQPLPEVIERNRHLHPRIRQVLVVVPQKHHLVVMPEMAIRNRDPRRPHYRIDQPVRAIRQRAVVDPDLARREDGDPVAVRLAPPPHVRGAGADVGVPGGLAVVDVDVVDDDVGDVLEREAAVAGDVDVGAAAVDGFEAVEDELVLEGDGHVAGEDDPEGGVLDHGVAEGSWGGVGGVGVGGVGDDVDLAAFPAAGVAAEANAAVGELLAKMMLGIKSKTLEEAYPDGDFVSSVQIVRNETNPDENRSNAMGERKKVVTFELPEPQLQGKDVDEAERD
ncbi:hypothetical protein G2W53_025643 [Senna tora]|uniref:Uncharacterized protein n=1 Tax=Senna tora TaxID=362788 RepID=A0A834WGP2_9FABA|nr:hypothetical protein G2W53_025643 [Senna tora]